MTQTATSNRTSAIQEIRRAIVNVAVPHHEPPRVVLRRRIVVAITLVLGAAILGSRCGPGPARPASTG